MQVGTYENQPKRLYVRDVLLIMVIEMEASVIKVSSKGQIVIPAKWRKRMDIKIGQELLAIGEGDTLLIKKIEDSALRTEFDDSVAPIRRKIKKLGITKEDVSKAIDDVRACS